MFKIGDKVVTPGGKVGVIDFIEDGYAELVDGSSFEDASVLKPYVKLEPPKPKESTGVNWDSPIWDEGKRIKKEMMERPLADHTETLFGHDFDVSVCILASRRYYKTSYMTAIIQMKKTFNHIKNWSDLSNSDKVYQIADIIGLTPGNLLHKLNDETDNFRVSTIELGILACLVNRPDEFL